MQGITTTARLVRVVDGDTLRVSLGTGEESLRLLCLDTEEANAGSTKPVTPWGKQASAAAKEIFRPGDEVTLELPGTEPLEEALRRYRDNFGRLLVFAYEPDGADFQEHWIRDGFSPYFTKYGYAEFPGHHARYRAAETQAQRANRGLWDQVAVNGSERRNYALLGVWWELRAQLVEEFRARRRAASGPRLFDSRLDYATLADLARTGERVTVFTELSELKRLGARKAAITIGSVHQPFQLFIPDLTSTAGQEIAWLLTHRYLGGDETHPRRGYAYVTGDLKLFGGRPELLLGGADQIGDAPPAG